ncbi:MAG: YkgJ family cysteine cluster protein [Archaeoglobaceae archaeon]|nr:YkgJ family cysteine cluster protein [Archaeoglobaceae archaeon]MDW8118938.1 YkgJ family cysteine cluster protein [Archaeoglobaceae archaeon]
MHVPWRFVASWHCNACGNCCKEYRVRLRAYEYLKLRNTGFIEEKAGRFYIKKIGKLCPFQKGNLCSLGNLKPLACKLYPFSVLEKGEETALFEFNGEEFFVYVDDFCKNLKLKRDLNPSLEIVKEIEEAIELALGKRFELNLLTAKSTQGTQSPPPHHHHRLTA